ncbi:MAG: tetratricopeptide repeat protein [Anaerovibrio sp.]|uniref:tetratricopeptide repeat protein n=1 Tax=Anaerovibrio sp. TaxID=1872532 RepID=UPI002620B3B8|nr:tetratricopeptide repeat protein [Anaerovibrio sp.]MDD7677205.1 tetratricopeptide repeat protein [Anaerovibrio sp.]
MAKKIKFALKMQDGAEVRNIEDLREHFDIDTVVGYFLDGRLLTWLGNFYYDTEADLVEKLDKNDGQLKKKLCEIFDVEYEDDGEFDVELAAKRREKLEKLKQYTADEKILSLVDNVAFDRDDMVELLDEEVDTIVLVDGTYRIPLREYGKKYIGVGNVVAEIKSKEIVNFDEIGIKFENIRFDDEYSALLKVDPVEDFRMLYEEAKEVGDKEKAFKYALKCAEAGEAYMMYIVGTAYEYGKGVDDDEKKAFEWYMNAAKNNDSYGMCKVGDFYSEGKIVAKNERKAFEWFFKAAKNKSVYGMLNVGDCYLLGLGVRKDDTEALKWYRKSAAMHSVWGVNKLAYCYRHGIGLSADIDKALELYSSIAEDDELRGTVSPMREMGDIYRLEDGYIDYEKSMQCYLKAIEMDENDGEAMNAVGLLLDDEYESFEWFVKSAEAGYCWGMYNVACGYYYGNGVSEDDAKAITWFEKAAEAGISDAMIKLGDIYRLGYGVTVNGKRAAEWYNYAIESGDTTGEAYCALGFLMESGMISSKGAWEKFYQFKQSAEAGYAWGMYKLGMCYLDGDGTNKDIDKGMEWIHQAADDGLEVARDFITDIENAIRVPDRSSIHEADVMAEFIWALNEVRPFGDSLHKIYFSYDNSLSKNLISKCQKGVDGIKGDERFIAIGVEDGLFSDEYMVISNKAIYHYENSNSWSRIPYSCIRRITTAGFFTVYTEKDEYSIIYGFQNLSTLGLFVALMAGFEPKKDSEHVKLLYSLKLDSLNGFSVGDVLFGEQ